MSLEIKIYIPQDIRPVQQTTEIALEIKTTPEVKGMGEVKATPETKDIREVKDMQEVMEIGGDTVAIEATGSVTMKVEVHTATRFIMDILRQVTIMCPTDIAVHIRKATTATTTSTRSTCGKSQTANGIVLTIMIGIMISLTIHSRP